jgi:hypothetical protein
MLLLSFKKLRIGYLTRTARVISRGIMMRGIFSFFSRTSLNAWGSKNMLNYAAGVMFPSPIAPPIITIFSIFSFTYGNYLSKKHKFVSAPVLAQTTLSGLFIMMSRIALNLF